MITVPTSGAPYLILGTYKPSKYRGSWIGPRILARIAHFGFKPLSDPAHGPQTTAIWCDPKAHAEVRRFAQPHGQGRAWHQDGDLADGSVMNHAEVLWSAVTPTQFMYNGKSTIYQPMPFEIVVARNLACLHRTPPDAPVPPTRRWFFRQRIEVPTNLELLP